ncbi:MAG: helix-turn-helix transcriptional regulator [Candidatus Pacebacteria bacterium]|nr:helix-turn-helix transcriptional regulator [Candidatus Paceibacterota bacterium]MCF7857183.1 helix-turn-helix transcriptional regulator [Candidatus Paceibacterota bacterium]
MTRRTKHTCPITKVITLLSDRWTMFIMSALIEEPKRFSELEKWLEQISSRTLTLKLKKLVEEGFVQKSDSGVYSLTKKGQGLRIVVRAMKKYNDLYLRFQ